MLVEGADWQYARLPLPSSPEIYPNLSLASQPSYGKRESGLTRVMVCISQAKKIMACEIPGVVPASTSSTHFIELNL